jgi:N-acyl amino acid synthase of PEP-CTERM/exosortase system
MPLQSVQHFAETGGAGSGIGFYGSGSRHETLLERFDCHFAAVPADQPELVYKAQKIRHQVYCVEHSYERPNAAGLERDSFDAHSVHSLLVHKASSQALGALRLVLPLENELQRCFPVQGMMDGDSRRSFNQLPLHSTAEVSRFSISRQLRRKAVKDDAHENWTVTNNSALLMRLGLMQAQVRMSMQHRITHWCAAMEPTFLRMLSAMAIHFHPVGPLVEYHELRQPCYGVIADILSDLRRERPEFWSVITDGGTLAG